MEFRKCKRNVELLSAGKWRLASVNEVRSHIRTIQENQILESWDVVRLLDGWVDGPGNRYNAVEEYRSNMVHMLLVKTNVSRPSDGTFDMEMYSGVELNIEGRKAALLLSCDDKITEVMCFVLKSIVDGFEDLELRQAELDRLTESLIETFSQRRTLLHYATDQPHNGKHAEFVAQLVLRNFEYGKELIKAVDKYGRTVLHFAALHGHNGLCTFLMNECGLAAHQKDRNGGNLLHFLVNSNKVHIVYVLWELTAVKNLILLMDAKGKTPLHKAAANGNTDIICTLLDDLDEEMVKKCIRQTDLFGQTVLLKTVRGGHCEAVRYLLNKGSRPLLERNSEGKTALHYCVQFPNQQTARDMAKILLNHYGSDEERLLLFWASAIDMGTAEQSAESSPQLQRFLKQQRELAAGSSSDLLLTAIKLGYDVLALEFIDRGAKTSQLNNLTDLNLSQVERERVKNFLIALERGDLRVKNMIEGDPDQPSIHDSLGRRVFAEGLAALFLNPYVKSPVTVGISGDWGIGKSSLMLQTEMILLQAAAQQAFPNILPIEDFPEQFMLALKDSKKYNKVKSGVRDLLPASEIADIDDPLVYFLDNYQDKYPQVYKSLALMERGEMDQTSDSSGNPRKIPNILTVRYDAWHYRNELEAWAGLAVTITKAMEETMTRSQKIRSCWRYAWKERGEEILLQFFLPCVLALFLSGWATWVVWMLFKRSKHSNLEGLKYGSIAITLVVVFWTLTRQLLSVFKPVTVQVMRYIRLPDHSTNLGYQHQVISDIKFLKEQICEKPSFIWKLLAGNWLWSDNVEDTSIPKSCPPSKNDLRIIVFIDDLDRSEDAVILKVLSAVNLVLAVCDINVILGMDKTMVSRAIAHNYQNQYPDSNNSSNVDADYLAERYLRKIVQLTLTLPDLDNDQRTQFLNQLLGKESGDEIEGSSRLSPGSEKLQSIPYIAISFYFIEEKHFLGESDAQPSDGDQNPRENVQQNHPRSIPEPLADADAQPSDIENPHENLLPNHPQSGPEKWLIISHLLLCFRALKRGLCRFSYSGPDISRSKLKSTIVNSRQLIMRSYSDEERKAISFLSRQTNHDPQLPREWKRFLLYHRLAWNIFFISKEGKNLPQWQVQLLVWSFCCWQWKDNVNRIIEDWKKLVSIKDDTIDDEDPTFRTIVRQYVDRIESVAEKEMWKSLIQILFTYDVTMESIQSFQKLRLHCDSGNPLRLPANVTLPMSSTAALESL
ncbi:hypothetical protein SUGI_0362970 [Cryptomeria japonica]|nr:hypothetical protein SUGI_0362970 [Cryptomeria japonica]